MICILIGFEYISFYLLCVRVSHLYFGFNTLGQLTI